MKIFKLLLLTLLFSGSSYAQVGIGTTTPDPSSMLDVTSDSQGLLVPRMTTAERNAITDPAKSLLVFDTTENKYYYNDGNKTTPNWIPINPQNEKRDNYVLVKDESDFPTSGTLDENTYYEINGTITLTKSINLNNAYVSGMDANEDVLSFPGGTVFAGNTSGGSIRNVTLKGDKAFEITGPGIAQGSLLVQNTIIDGMSTSVGSISGFGLYFGNIVQFVNNTDGITYSDIGNLLLNNQAWLDSNGGTYEKLTGTFGLVEKVSGFSTVKDGATGFDVSSNPTVGEGVLLGTVFTRPTGGTTGVFINEYTAGSYTGYNFTNDWTVDCPGIPRESDDVATGDINFSSVVGSGQTTSFTGMGSSSRKKIQGTTTSNNLFRFTKNGDNRITYRGNKTRYFQVAASVSYQGTDDLTLILYIAKNGTVITQTKVYGRAATGFFVSGGILALPI